MYDKCDTDVPDELDLALQEQVEEDAVLSLEALEREEVDILEVMSMEGLGYGELSHGD